MQRSLSTNANYNASRKQKSFVSDKLCCIHLTKCAALSLYNFILIYFREATTLQRAKASINAHVIIIAKRFAKKMANHLFLVECNLSLHIIHRQNYILIMHSSCFIISHFRIRWCTLMTILFFLSNKFLGCLVTRLIKWSIALFCLSLIIMKVLITCVSHKLYLDHWKSFFFYFLSAR